MWSLLLLVCALPAAPVEESASAPPSDLPAPSPPGPAVSARSLFPASEASEQAAEEVPEPITVAAPLLPRRPVVPPAERLALAAGLLPTGTTPPIVPDRWWFMHQVQGTWLGAALDDNRLYALGWIEQSFTASTDRVTNSTVVWNDRANQYLFQQGWVRFGRSVINAGTTEPTFGFQIDILNGSDYRFTLPRGLFNSQLDNSVPGSQNLYGVDPIQHYVSMYVPTLFRGTEIRLGRVYTPWGVESLEALVTFSPEWTSVLMLANGNDVYFGDPSEELRFVGNVRWIQPGGGRNTVTLATSLGRGKFNPAFATPPNQTTVALATEPFGRNNFNAFDLVYTHTFSPVFSYNLEAIYGYQTNVPQAALAVGSVNGFANWFSAAHYLFYTFSPKMTGILRYENFMDFQGQRTGFAGLYTAITGGIQYRFNKSMILRPELRYDNNALQTPFEGKHSLFTAASDLIIRW